MAELNIGSATYGRDFQGRKKLSADIADDLKKIGKELTGSELKNLYGTIDKYWSGKDATAFKKKIDTEVNNIVAEVKQLIKYFDQDLDADAKAFEKLQNKNANAINGL